MEVWKAEKSVFCCSFKKTIRQYATAGFVYPDSIDKNIHRLDEKRLFYFNKVCQGISVNTKYKFITNAGFYVNEHHHSTLENALYQNLL